jgi:nitric oxide synthase oxygenase domain/subunit
VNKDVNIADKIIKELSNDYGFKTINKIEEAISLLQSHGYKVEAPYTDPTDKEICERIRHENEKAGWTADWSDFSCVKCVIYYSNEEKKWFYWELVESEIIGMTYTSIEIAETIVAELNEKRFVRV